MKTLLLAGGIGSRISRYLEGKPKCTVSLGKETLIEYTTKLLHKKGITEIALTLGYKADVIKDVLKPLEKECNIKYYFNPFFDVTNSIASAWFAREFFTKKDIIIMNGDVFLEESLVDDILSEQKNPVLFSDETRKATADYKFKYSNNILEKYGKELTGDDITGEYVGIAKLKADFIPIFLNNMEEMIKTQKHNVWWENVLYTLSDKQPIYIQDVKGKFWAEVDYIEDYERILNFVKSNNK